MEHMYRYRLSFSFYIVVVCVMISLAILGSKTADVISENTQQNIEHIVIIDAGHGGIDGGATSCTGIPEKDFNLRIAERLDNLMNFLGVHTKMIRTTDTSVHTTGTTIASKKVSDLKERVRIVNETRGSFLISIHQNYFPESRYSGTQVFYSPTGDSADFANKLQETFVKTLNPENNRQAKQASGVYLMEQIKAPGVLIECGFISNVQEEAKLRTDEYQKKICCVIAAQVTSYVNYGAIA